MTQTSYPFDGQATTETQFSQFFKEFVESGVAASADSLALNVSADSGGMRVFVQPGFAIVRGFAYNSTAVEQLTVTAANVQARVDRVVLRLDPTVNSVVLAVKPGTPGSSTPPALTQTDTAIYELPLALIAVGSSVSVIAPGNLTDERVFSDQGVSNWSTSTRPSAPRVGKVGYNRTTGEYEFWNGSAYAQMVPSTPIGSVIMYGGTSAPAGWHLCDGSAHGSTALQAVIGSANTPDLRGRFVVGTGPGYAQSATGGAATVTLTGAESGTSVHGHGTVTSGSMSANAVHAHSAWSDAAGYHDHNNYGSNLLTAEGDFNPAGSGYLYMINQGQLITGGGSHAHGVGVNNASVEHSHQVTPNASAAANAAAAHENRPPYYALTYIIRKS